MSLSPPPPTYPLYSSNTSTDSNPIFIESYILCYALGSKPDAAEQSFSHRLTSLQGMIEYNQRHRTICLGELGKGEAQHIVIEGA